MVFTSVLMDAGSYPVGIRPSGIKTGIVVLLLVVFVIMTMIISMWSRMPRMVDAITMGRTDLTGRFDDMKPEDDHALRVKYVMITAFTGLLVLFVWLFLPQLGSSTLAFSQFSDEYQVTEVKPGDGFDHSLLNGSGSSFKISSEKHEYPVEWIPDGSSLVKTGTIQVLNGRARLMGSDGAQPALK